MKKLLLALIMGMFFATAGMAKTITMTPENTITLRDAISDESVSQVIMKLITNSSDTVYIFINSPGGSVPAGNNLINAMNGLGKKTICIADFAASMAFSLLQACTERYIVGGAIIMQHEISFGARGSLSQVRKTTELAAKLADKLNKADAKRLGMDLKTFQDKVRYEWWLVDEEIIQNNAADGFVNVKCSETLAKGREVQTIESLFGKVTLEWSTCPLLNYPVAIQFAQKVGVDPKDYIAWAQSLSMDRNWKTRRVIK